MERRKLKQGGNAARPVWDMGTPPRKRARRGGFARHAVAPFASEARTTWPFSILLAVVGFFVTWSVLSAPPSCGRMMGNGAHEAVRPWDPDC